MLLAGVGYLKFTDGSIRERECPVLLSNKWTGRERNETIYCSLIHMAEHPEKVSAPKETSIWVKLSLNEAPAFIFRTGHFLQGL